MVWLDAVNDADEIRWRGQLTTLRKAAAALQHAVDDRFPGRFGAQSTDAAGVIVYEAHMPGRELYGLLASWLLDTAADLESAGQGTNLDGSHPLAVARLVIKASSASGG